MKWTKWTKTSCSNFLFLPREIEVNNSNVCDFMDRILRFFQRLFPSRAAMEPFFGEVEIENFRF